MATPFLECTSNHIVQIDMVLEAIIIFVRKEKKIVGKWNSLTSAHVVVTQSVLYNYIRTNISLASLYKSKDKYNIILSVCDVHTRASKKKTSIVIFFKFIILVELCSLKFLLILLYHKYFISHTSLVHDNAFMSFYH